MRWRNLESLEVSHAHVLTGIAVGILSLVLRNVISRGRDEYGAVEKTLKGILTICTVLVFPVVVALSCTNYNGVKRSCYGGSVVPAMPPASGIRVFIHDEAQGGCSTRVKALIMDWYASCTSARSRTPRTVPARVPNALQLVCVCVREHLRSEVKPRRPTSCTESTHGSWETSRLIAFRCDQDCAPLACNQTVQETCCS